MLTQASINTGLLSSLSASLSRVLYELLYVLQYLGNMKRNSNNNLNIREQILVQLDQQHLIASPPVERYISLIRSLILSRSLEVLHVYTALLEECIGFLVVVLLIVMIPLSSSTPQPACTASSHAQLEIFPRSSPCSQARS